MFYTRQALLKAIPCLSHGNTYLKQSHVLHMAIFTLLSQDLRDHYLRHATVDMYTGMRTSMPFQFLTVVLEYIRISNGHAQSSHQEYIFS